MKFTSLKQKDRKILHIPIADKGMNLTKPTLHIRNDEIGLAKNIFYENGFLKTRNGIYTNENRILKNSRIEYAKSYKVNLTDTEYIYNGESMRIATVEALCDMTHYTILVYLLGEGEKIVYLGYQIFHRLNSEIFYLPENITFFVGKAINGRGIFAFVTLTDMYSGEKDFAVYEIGEDEDYWNRVTEYYTPTVYINGRGNAYEEAKALNKVSEQKPRVLESPNLLYTRFYAYFSSDGFSHSFRLPYNNLEDSTIECIIHTSPTSYTRWLVSAGESYKTENFENKEVTFNISRTTGTFYFTTSNGNFPINLMPNYNENNIRIAASINDDSDYANIVSSTTAKKIGSKTFFTGGIENNKLYYSDYENPLYFPLLCDNEIGSEDKKVNALCVTPDEIYAFKSNEIYKIGIKGSKAVNTTALLADNGKIFTENLEFDIKIISNTIGCEFVKTVSVSDNKPVFFGSDFKVYTLSSANELKPISDNIQPVLRKVTREQLENAIGAASNNNYYFALSNQIAVITLEKEPCCYLWELPTEIMLRGIFESAKDTVFILQNADSEVIFTATLKGEKDIVFDKNGVLETKNISTYLKFKSYYLSENNCRKFLHTAYFNLSVKEKSKILLGEKENNEEFIIRKGEFSSNGQDTVKLLVNLRGIESVDIILESEGAMSFGGADFYFTEMAN